MPKNTPQKVSVGTSTKAGASYLHELAAGDQVGMRMWTNEKPGEKDSSMHARDYETVGYVIEGRAKLHCEGETFDLEPGDSWFVPANAEHRYEIIQEFTAVEATSPPSQRS